MLAFVRMTFLVRRYGDSRHEDEAKRNPNGHCVDKTGSPGRGFPFCNVSRNIYVKMENKNSGVKLANSRKWMFCYFYLVETKEKDKAIECHTRIK